MVGHFLDNRYEILERIGGGGMADVYRAHDTLLDRYVAVKVLHAQFANDDDFVAKFRREAQGAAKLSHPNIVNIYDVGEENNKHYIIMEYVSGETLKERVQREGSLSIKEALRISREIAEALEHAHQNNLVHCDIKPHNILVMPNGRLKVTDFGIARAVTSSTMTYSGMVIGSVHYFSPEQAKGGAVNTQSDIYSLGVVLYEMLTGTMPFSGENPVSIALKHLQEEPVPIHALNRNVPAIVEAIVIKAMEKDTKNRFPTITSMIADILVAESSLALEQKSTREDEFATRVLPAVKDDRISTRKKDASSGVVYPVKSKKIVVGLVIILVLSFAMGLFLSYGKFWSSNEVEVPNVAGKTTEVAKKLLEDANLRVNLGEAFDDTVPKGQVVSQYPEAGAVVKEQRQVTIYISKGGEAVKMPDLRGISRRDAELKLKNAGLKIGKIDEVESDEPADIVISQSPRPETQVTKGYSVDFVVSQGKKVKQVTLPDFKGSSISTIESQLQSLGLKVGTVTEEVDGKAAAGTILKQSPEAGKQVIADTAIDFTVAKAADVAKQKSTMLELTVPEGADKQAVRIVVTDKDGRRTVYENVHKPGDKISKSLSGSGDLRMQIYINGNLVQEKTI